MCYNTGMERFELEQSLADEIRARVFSGGFIKIVQTVRRDGKTFRIAMRPVEIGGETRYQAEMTDDGRVQVKNFSAQGAAQGLEEIIAQRGAREMHLITSSGDLHVRVTKKGRALVSRSAALERPAEILPHDRVKKLPLTSFESAAFLKAAGLADADGRIRASMRGKYDQVNEFLKVVAEVLKAPPGDGSTFTVVDCGCGKAYLTIALYLYLVDVLKFPSVKVVGVDRRADVVAAASRMAADLDVSSSVSFVEADLSSFDLSAAGVSRADMVISLYACDTATDEALARGVEWKARHILSAPCCQHELQKSISAKSSDAFAGVLRHGILRERLCDILTDSFRAMILRILGFKTQVMEFVSSDATARNLMLRAEFSAKPGQAGVVSEYLNLRDFWHVTPWLETRLSSVLSKYLERYV